MDDNATPIGKLLEYVEDYSRTSLELLRLKAIDLTATIVSTLVSSLAITLTVALSLFILNIGIALWIGRVLGELYYGFLIVGGFYLLLALILYIFRKPLIVNRMSDSIVREMMKKSS